MYTKITVKDKEICLIDKNYPNQAINVPIYQNSIFHFNTLDDYISYKKREINAYCYTRGNNPTTEVLEDKLAKLDNGEACRVFSSGMGAISATFFALLKTGDHVLIINDIYGPTKEYLSVLSKFGIEFDIISVSTSKNFEGFIKENTRIIYTESPGSMTFNSVDLKHIANIAKSKSIYTIIDNTCMTPLLQKPLSLGFDIAVYSLSKYTGGHSDVLAGAVVTSNEILTKIDKEGYKLGGSVISPNDSFLVLRGLRTLPSRLEALTLTTQKVVNYLQSNKKVKKIFHPLVYDADELELYRAQTTGITSLLSIKLVTTNTLQTEKFIDNLKTFSIAVSWGGYENLIMVQDISEFNQLQSDNIIIRLALGLLDANTIIEDLEQAFNQIEGE